MQYDQDNAQSVQKSIFYPLSAEKSFSERFDILQKDVETLKEEEAHQSASHSATPKAESSHGPESFDRSETSDDAEMSTTRRRRKIRETRSQEISKRRSTSRYRFCSGSCLPRDGLASRDKSSSKCKASAKQRRTRHSICSWVDRMLDLESERKDSSGRIVFSDSEAEDQPNTRLVEVLEKTKHFSMKSALGECLTVTGRC